MALKDLINDSSLMEILIPAKIQFCTHFTFLSLDWPNWELQNLAYPKEFIVKVIDSIFKENVSFGEFITAIVELKPKEDTASMIERWTKKSSIIDEKQAPSGIVSVLLTAKGMKFKSGLLSSS